ncbi:MAG: TIR domain-containing protein, partial [Saprospiraceae bacterium]
MEYKYQIALSFAGEDRAYVDKVAELLKENDISVFYDKFEQVDLWGKDLGIHFDYIYRRQSQYFIPFISAHYKEKIWTNYEVRTAIARAIENKEEYILPVRFDDTE